MREVRILRSGLPFIELMALMFWFLIRFPGLPHTDTSVQLKLIQDGLITNQWTLPWFLLLKFLTFGGLTLAVITALQIVVLYLTLRVVTLAFFEHIPGLKVALTLLTCTPYFGYTATTVNHDLLAACGTILFTVELVNYFARKNPIRLQYLVAATFLSLFTYGAFFVALCSLVILFAFERRIRHVILISLLAFMLILNFTFPGNLNRGESAITLISDLKCALEDPEVKILDRDLVALSELAPKRFWNEVQEFPCVASIRVYSELKTSAVNPPEIARIWFRVTKANPDSFIKSHMARASFVIPPPLSSKPSEVMDVNSNQLYVKHNIEFLTMDRSVTTQQIPWIGFLRDLSDLWAQICNLLTGWISWAGMWLLLISLVFARSFKKFNNPISFRSAVLGFSPLILLHAFLFVNVPGAEARHVLATILIGILVIISIVQQFFKEIFGKNKTVI